MRQVLLNNLQQTVTEGELQITSLPLCPRISLYLLSDHFPKGRLEYEEMMAIMNAPAYWAFCWASGQVLASYIINHPREFQDKQVLDFGSGSGVVAIAACLAGASRVIACDLDPHALDACRANAELNNVEFELLDDVLALEGRVDLIIAADVLYDQDNIPWIEKLHSMENHVLIADSRVKTDRLSGYRILDRVTATTIPDLDEFKEFCDVRIYRKNQPVPLPEP